MTINSRHDAHTNCLLSYVGSELRCSSALPCIGHSNPIRTDPDTSPLMRELTYPCAVICWTLSGVISSCLTVGCPLLSPSVVASPV